ncbi:hypothetical protein NW762_010761 [Fusarium torreyae]|uniref:SMP-30/Gluconolactonase/LRE-like region domain-containing protein n=1 Tax=Fusarium torreyae TaxID=1237075 RepID=A0A9W8RTU7_9HYPO|nr:hypothetical protein NW762_010761 [Fusarium torreyae]
MNPRIQAFVPPHTQLGESPLYRESDDTLHYVDVLGQSINILRMDGSLQRRTIQCPEPITFLGFHRDGGYIICSFSSIVRVSDEGEWKVQRQVFADVKCSRLNDAGIDSAGRLWVGSIDRIGVSIPKSSVEAEQHQAIGCIFRYDPDGNLTVMQNGGVFAGNGLCWSPDNKLMYFVDSYKDCVWAYDFDVSTGEISNRRSLVTRQDPAGEADGLLTDSDGNLYTFIWEGGAVIKYSSDGNFLEKWHLNANRVTHGAWVGDGLRDMVVTSARKDVTDSPWKGEEGGGLFYLPGCSRGGLRKNVFG